VESREKESRAGGTSARREERRTLTKLPEHEESLALLGLHSSHPFPDDVVLVVEETVVREQAKETVSVVPGGTRREKERLYELLERSRSNSCSDLLTSTNDDEAPVHRLPNDV